ncbi:uncharacterized protein LOC144556006 [Carex rostrata]
MALRQRSASVYSLIVRQCQVKASPTVGFCSDSPVHNFSTWKQYFPTSPTSPLKLTNFISPVYSLTQSRPASQATESKIAIGPELKRTQPVEGKESGLVYVGPISSTIKKVKLLSLSTCCLSVSLGPVITFMTSPEMNVILKGAVASTVIFLSASTTAALHWFVSPYIHKLRWQPGSDSFESEMMSWLATPLRKTIKFAEVRRADTNRPFVTFKADGNYYFVDADHFQNKALLARLTPEKGSQESAFKNL